MISFRLKKTASIPRDDLFKISTNISGFVDLMPKYFKKIEVYESIGNEIKTKEELVFFGKSLIVNVRHVIIAPEIHEVHLLTGPSEGSVFVERYMSSNSGCEIKIDIHLKFSGLYSIFSKIFGFFIKEKMRKIMNEFIDSSIAKYRSLS